MPHSTSTRNAPWKPSFAQNLAASGDGSSIEFSLATVTDQGLPRVRTIVHRGFWASLPGKPSNTLRKNPEIYESDCPTFTTSAHLSKVSEIISSSPHCKGRDLNYNPSRFGSGGGGPVEAVYWLKDLKVQWRIRGTCWLVAADDVDNDLDGEEEAEDPSTPKNAVKMMKAAVDEYMRHRCGVVDDESGDGWSWRREVENYYHNLTPTERGTFERNNFRVGIILPDAVERRDMTDPAVSNKRFWGLAEVASNGSGGGERPKAAKTWVPLKTWPS